MKSVFRQVRTAWMTALLLAALTAGVTGLASPASAEEPAKLMDYSVSLVSDYVFRGLDVYSSVYNKREEDESAFNLSPAVQPSVTFYSASGLWFNFWGSFALTDRDEDEKKGFDGLAALDEVDTTFGYDWSNKLGSFSFGLINYALVNPSAQGEPGADIQEMFFKWGLPLLASVAPKLSHYVDSSTAATYTALSIGGGEGLTWAANVGYGSRSHQGVDDVTGTIAYDLGGGLSVNANVAYRPVPQMHGYSSDGKHISAKDGSEQDYPPALFWVGVTWGGAVHE